MSEIKCSLRTGISYQAVVTISFAEPKAFTFCRFLSTETQNTPGNKREAAF